MQQALLVDFNLKKFNRLVVLAYQRVVTLATLTECLSLVKDQLWARLAKQTLPSSTVPVASSSPSTSNPTSSKNCSAS